MNYEETGLETQVCNICGSTDFGRFAKRSNARCTQCLSLERSRGMMYLIEREGLLKPGMRVLHFAPERGLGLKIIDTVGRDNYEAYDLFPNLYSDSLGVRRFDLTEPHLLQTARYDLILHAHVLEHIPVYVAVVLWHLQRALKPEGTHLFSIPLTGKLSESDFSNISEEERERRFGQKDHVRRFGKLDLETTLGQVFEFNARTHGLEIDPDAARKHNIRADEIRDTVFRVTEEDFLLSRSRHGTRDRFDRAEP